MSAPAPPRPSPAAPSTGRPAGRAGVLARVLRTEVRRGGGLLAAALTLVLGVALLVVQRGDWAARMPVLVAIQRADLALIGPLVAAVATWCAQRERRSAVGSLLDSTARPPWHRVVLGWAAVTAGAVVGHLVAFLLAAATVVVGPGPRGGGWPLELLAGVVSLAALTALGVLVGHLVRYRLAAPVLAVAVFVAASWYGVPTGDDEQAPTWLLSPAVQPTWGTDRIAASATLLQVAWFAAAAVALLALAAARPRVRAVPAVVAAVAAGAGLVAAPGSGVVRDDRAAQVCTGTAPLVCVDPLNAFLLPDVDREVRAVFARVSGVPDLPTEVRPMPSGSYTPGEGVIHLLPDLPATLGGRLADPDELRSWVLSEVVWAEYCGAGLISTTRFDPWETTPSALSDLERTGAVRYWSDGDLGKGDYDRVLAALRGLDRPAQDEVLVAYLTAVRTCDEAALTALRTRLGVG